METYASGGYTESVVSTSALNNPVAVALDGAGDVYIADNGNNRALLEALSAGTYSETVLSTSPMMAPSGIAVVNGSVFIADTQNGRLLWENLTAPPSLTFALTPPQQVRDVIYVDVKKFDKLKTEKMRDEIERLNIEMIKENRKYILIGPGHWGTETGS